MNAQHDKPLSPPPLWMPLIDAQSHLLSICWQDWLTEMYRHLSELPSRARHPADKGDTTHALTDKQR